VVNREIRKQFGKVEDVVSFDLTFNMIKEEIGGSLWKLGVLWDNLHKKDDSPSISDNPL